MSEAAKHTPGPWRYQEESDAYTHIVRAGENFFVCQLPQSTRGRAEADARLIAAAPDLLRVAELLVSWLDEDEGAHKLCDTARAAIAKATGA